MLRQGCSLSMLHRTCEILHGNVRLDGLRMPNILHMPFFLSSEILRNTLSHIWCKLKLPIFLLSVGLLTLIVGLSPGSNVGTLHVMRNT